MLVPGLSSSGGSWLLNWLLCNGGGGGAIDRGASVSGGRPSDVRVSDDDVVVADTGGGPW